MWRTDTGVHAAPAQCPHGGADLGGGKVIDGCFTCPYHGIRFATDGAAVHRPAVGTDDHIPAGAGLATLPAVDAHGYIWIWHGDVAPMAWPDWFNTDEPTVTVGADQIWTVHYSRFVESALDFHHVPFVHGIYTPGVGQQLTDVEAVDERASHLDVGQADRPRLGSIAERGGRCDHAVCHAGPDRLHPVRRSRHTGR
jgi:phenylpropionate dioxygenase-like ring-hydroxylating dioxygenase large terminal subunit